MLTLVYAPLLLILPVVVGGILHSLIIRARAVPQMAVPISERWFGRHKTYRGFIVMPITCVLGVYAAVAVERHLPRLHWVGFERIDVVLVGIVLGLAYMLFELPNSFLKRRLGVREGAPAHGRRRWLFFVADQVDSVVGGVLVCAIFFNVGATVLLATAVIGTVAHFTLNVGLYLIGIRRQPL